MSDHQPTKKDKRRPLTSLLLRWGINALAIAAAIALIPGLRVEEGSASTFLLIALVFGLVNAFIRPVIILLTCPALILTLGLGTLLVNAGLFWLTAEISQQLGLGFFIDDFWAAFFGALIVSITSAAISGLVGEE